MAIIKSIINNSQSRRSMLSGSSARDRFMTSSKRKRPECRILRRVQGI